MSRTEARAVSAAVAALAILGMLRAAYTHFLIEPRELPPAAQRSDARYAALRAHLPTAGEIGYVSDLPPETKPGEISDVGSRLYHQALYALAPLVLVHGDTSRGLVIANPSRPEALEEICRRDALVAVVQFDSGVALVRRRAR